MKNKIFLFSLMVLVGASGSSIATADTPVTSAMIINGIQQNHAMQMTTIDGKPWQLAEKKKLVGKHGGGGGGGHGGKHHGGKHHVGGHHDKYYGHHRHHNSDLWWLAAPLLLNSVVDRDRDVYECRVYFRDRVRYGTINPRNGLCYVRYHGEVIRFSDYRRI